MKGQTAVEYLMTYGWAILIILIVAGVLAYYGIFAPQGFLGPTARGFGQVQVLNPWSLSSANGAMTINMENRVGGTIKITAINYTLTSGGTGSYGATITTQCTSGCEGCPTACTNDLTSGKKATVASTLDSGTWSAKTAGDSWTATVTIYYYYPSDTTNAFSSTGTLSGTYS
jgi:hypothetical protein